MRHTKQQRIQGAVALALPSTKSETIWLTMTSDERSMYDATKKHIRSIRWERNSHNKLRKQTQKKKTKRHLQELTQHRQRNNSPK